MHQTNGDPDTNVWVEWFTTYVIEEDVVDANPTEYEEMEMLPHTMQVEWFTKFVIADVDSVEDADPTLNELWCNV